MPEGVALSTGKIVGDATYDDRNSEPAPDPVNAPLGWRWERSERRWVAKKPRGRRPSQPRQDTQAAPAPAAADTSAAGADERPDRDPDPGWFAPPDDEKPGRKKGRQLSFDDVPEQVRNDIAGFAGLVGAPVLGLLQAADPYCGTALAQNFEPIIDACLPLLCRSEKIVSYFSGDKSDWLLWGKLAMALAPVGRAIYEHHVRKSVEVVRDPATGIVHFAERNRGGSEHGDHLVPPAQPEFAYSA